MQSPAAMSATPVRATNLNAAELQGRQISDLYARTDGLDTKMEALFARMEARMEANIQNAMQKLAFDVADVAKVQREGYQKLSIGMDALQLGMDQNTTTINALTKRVQDIQDKMDSKLPELEIKQDNLRKETAQCFQELCDRNQADMWSLEKNVALKIEAELDAAFKHIDQQINRVSGELRQEMKVKDDEFEARVNQGFSDLEHQMDKQHKVEEVDQLTSETEANKKQKHNCDSESEKEADDIVKINKIKRGGHIKESNDPLFFRKSQIIEARPRRSGGGGDSSPSDSDSNSSSEGSRHGKNRSRGYHGSRKGRSLIVKTREDFKYLALKHLDRCHMEELIDFLDEYELVSDRNPQADLRMVHFMEKDVLAIFTSTATDLNIIDPLMESSGIQRLSDRKTRKVIYEILKAQSIQDFKDRLKILKFPSTDKGELVPSMGNFRRLHDAANSIRKEIFASSKRDVKTS